MEALNAGVLAAGAVVLVDTAPIIYVLENRPVLAQRFLPIFERHAAGDLRIAITTITMAEVLTGPLSVGDEALARRFRTVLESWDVFDLTADLAESAARLRKALNLRLPDAIQAATALAIGADALVTHDRDFSRLTALNVLR